MSTVGGRALLLATIWRISLCQQIVVTAHALVAKTVVGSLQKDGIHLFSNLWIAPNTFLVLISWTVGLPMHILCRNSPGLQNSRHVSHVRINGDRVKTLEMNIRHFLQLVIVSVHLEQAFLDFRHHISSITVKMFPPMVALGHEMRQGVSTGHMHFQLQRDGGGKRRHTLPCHPFIFEGNPVTIVVAYLPHHRTRNPASIESWVFCGDQVIFHRLRRIRNTSRLFLLCQVLYQVLLHPMVEFESIIAVPLVTTYSLKMGGKLAVDFYERTRESRKNLLRRDDLIPTWLNGTYRFLPIWPCEHDRTTQEDM